MKKIKDLLLDSLNSNKNKFLRKLINFVRFLLLKTFGIVEYNFKPENLISYRNLTIYLKDKKFEEAFTSLKKGMDYKSQIVLDTIFLRMYRNEGFVYSFNLSKNELEDLLKLKGYNSKNFEPEAYDELLLKLEYPGFSGYEVSVFKFHHGLRLLNRNSLKYIEGKDLVDAGSCEGESAVVLSKNYSFNKIHSFELEKDNYQKSIKIINKNFNYLKNIDFINKGLSNKTEKIKMDEFTSIDDFFNSKNSIIGIIKFDIEGAEYKAIQGAINTIKEHLPILIVSIYHNPRDFFEIKPLIEKIVPGKYDFYFRKLNPGYTAVDCNLICIPKNIGGTLLNLNEDRIYG